MIGSPLDSTRPGASQDATVGSARTKGGLREGGHSRVIIARASAVAIGVIAAALLVAPSVLADSGPPASTTPTSTTPDAPPPDPYHPPVKVAPKPRATTRSAPVVHSAPATRSYTPPAAAPVVPVTPVRSVPRHRAVRPHPKKVVHKRKARVVHRHVAPLKPVKVTFNPFANSVPSAIATVAAGDSDRGRYLWLAGLAFAFVAAAGMSLHALSVRWFGASA